jgi:very-short-patch-repair endonuclease
MLGLTKSEIQKSSNNVLETLSLAETPNARCDRSKIPPGLPLQKGGKTHRRSDCLTARILNSGIPVSQRGAEGDLSFMFKYNPRLKTKARKQRRNLTDAERRLWTRLKGKQILDIQLYRQKPIGKYIVDFYANAPRLVIEVDGAQYLDGAQLKYDKQRSGYLNALGLKVLRFDDRGGLA